MFKVISDFFQTHHPVARSLLSVLIFASLAKWSAAWHLLREQAESGLPQTVTLELPES
jgi:hypothetical protein